MEYVNQGYNHSCYPPFTSGISQPATVDDIGWKLNIIPILYMINPLLTINNP